MSDLQINRTINYLKMSFVYTCVHTQYDTTRIHVQTYLKNKIVRCSNISKITKQSYFVICLNYYKTSFKNKNVNCPNYSTTSLKYKNVRCLK